MNNLVQKAIQAIKDGKNEYAIGLLEGILEIHGVSQETTGPAGTSVVSPTINVPRPDDEGSALDALTASRLEDIMKSANIEMA